MELNTDQKTAVHEAAINNFSIITGGAGTGKTTIIKEIAEQATNPRLCCFAGKAAARLREATGMETSTIHSLLGFDGTGFRNTGLERVTVIIDEASMVNSNLIAEIIKRKPAKLVLVGDEAQLPPVGGGQPFHDLIKLRPDSVTNLSICYRNKEAVFKAAMKIRNGEAPLKKDKSDGESWEIRHTGDSDQTIETLLTWIKAGAMDFERDIILSSKNEFVDKANEEILKIVNPHEDGEKWKQGDRVMCLKNAPDIDTWNGTTGTITGIDDRGRAWVKGDIPFVVDGISEAEILWDKAVLKNCKHAYALTVHKSQGSQYRRVIFCSFQVDVRTILSRSLIYTAVTRTKKNCIVIGNSHAFYTGIKIVKDRNTVIQELSKVKGGGE